jgi:hypothetical protein
MPGKLVPSTAATINLWNMATRRHIRSGLKAYEEISKIWKLQSSCTPFLPPLLGLNTQTLFKIKGKRNISVFPTSEWRKNANCRMMGGLDILNIL